MPAEISGPLSPTFTVCPCCGHWAATSLRTARATRAAGLSARPAGQPSAPAALIWPAVRAAHTPGATRPTNRSPGSHSACPARIATLTPSADRCSPGSLEFRAIAEEAEDGTKRTTRFGGVALDAGRRPECQLGNERDVHDRTYRGRTRDTAGRAATRGRRSGPARGRQRGEPRRCYRRAGRSGRSTGV